MSYDSAWCHDRDIVVIAYSLKMYLSVDVHAKSINWNVCMLVFQQRIWRLNVITSHVYVSKLKLNDECLELLIDCHKKYIFSRLTAKDFKGRQCGGCQPTPKEKEHRKLWYTCSVIVECHRELQPNCIVLYFRERQHQFPFCKPRLIILCTCLNVLILMWETCYVIDFFVG